MKTFITSYKDINVSRTYWKEGSKVFVRYIADDTNKVEEILTDSDVKIIHFLGDGINYFVETKDFDYQRIKREDEIKYLAALANLTIPPPDKK